MWNLDNRTPFACDRSWTRDRDGREVWLVAVKGTYAIAGDGALTLAAKQESPLQMAEHYGDPVTSSARYESDLTLPKPCTDIVMNGHAYAPNGEPATQVEVGLALDGVFKKPLTVFGDRIFKNGKGATSAPTPFTKMPLRWERAFGGTDRRSADPRMHGQDDRNPVGCGFAIDSAALEGTSAPNIEVPSAPLSAGLKKVQPGGFGPIASHWMPRRALAGTYDAAWEATRKPLFALDLDAHFFCAAPADQQTPAPLVGGETLVLVNLSERGRLQFDLPRVALSFASHFPGHVEPHRAQMSSVIIEPDASRVMIVWLSALTVGKDGHDLFRCEIEMET